MQENSVSRIGNAHSRYGYTPFGIKQSDRLVHMYLLGKTGTGKSTLLRNLIQQDIASGRGCMLVDPHGDMAAEIQAKISDSGRNRVIYFDAAAPDCRYGYNPLRHVDATHIPLVASSIMETLRTLWEANAWGVRMEHVLRNILYALLEYGEATFADILRLPVDEVFRAEVLARVANKTVRRFWEEWEKHPPSYRREVCAPIENKVGAFLADPRLYRILVEPEQELSIADIMQNGVVLLVNLSKGRLGSDTARMLGSLLIGTVAHAAFARAAIPEAERRPFFLYIDEFQHFTTDIVVSMISEARKYRVGLILAHQHIHQLSEDVRHAILANVGTVVCFRIGAFDASTMAKYFSGYFEADDLLNLPYHTIALSLMVDGQSVRAFTADTLPT